MNTIHDLPPGLAINAPVSEAFASILSADALSLYVKLARKFEPVRQSLLAARVKRQQQFDAGVLPDFLPETKAIREGNWRVAGVPADFQDRRVEITGPTDRKMVINALNSGASTFLADFEDANCPTWQNMIEGQINLRDANLRTIRLEQNGKNYRLNDKVAVLIPRPRGWHLDEKHITIDGKPVSGAIFDFAMYFVHNVKTLLARGSGVYLYLPKMESHLEARLWNDIFVMAQNEMGVPQGSIKATVLIETIVAAFEMDEILYELREHSAGLNIGRWDYIFSAIKKFRLNKDFCLADRASVTMLSPFLRAYALTLVKTCHKRGTFAMGGMAAQIPIKNDEAANAAAFEKVRADKIREVTDGCDGTWVAHPGLVGVAKAVFDEHMPTPNQISRQRDDVSFTARDLLDFRPESPITEAGLRNNIQVGIQYVGSWLAGNGCVPIFNLMEDAATAEISRSQVWQWIRSPKGVLADGRKVTKEMVAPLIADELKKTPGIVGDAAYAAGKYAQGAAMLEKLIMDDTYEEFLTLPAYRAIA
jgi:malate synthase